jgi:hypothetical protein
MYATQSIPHNQVEQQRTPVSSQRKSRREQFHKLRESELKRIHRFQGLHKRRYIDSAFYILMVLKTRLKQGWKWVINKWDFCRQYDIPYRTFDSALRKLREDGLIWQEGEGDRIALGWLPSGFETAQEIAEFAQEPARVAQEPARVAQEPAQEIFESVENVEFEQDSRFLSDFYSDSLLGESESEDLWSEVEVDQPSSQEVTIEQEEIRTSTNPDEGKCSAPPRPTSKKVKPPQPDIDVKHLLEDMIFIMWWANRVKKTKFGAEELEMPPEAYVKARIRKHPAQALDMYEAFKQEMTLRVDNFQTRIAAGGVISPEEQEEIRAIAPYAATSSILSQLPPAPTEQRTLPAVSDDSAPAADDAVQKPAEITEPSAPSNENASAYKLHQPKQVEKAPPPPSYQGLLEKLKANAAKMAQTKKYGV